MAKRSNTTFVKRQKEMARKAKRQEKLERREERKRQKESGEPTGFNEIVDLATLEGEEATDLDTADEEEGEVGAEDDPDRPTV
jgi:hypothetical protein